MLTVQLNRVLQDCAPPDDRAWSILREAQRQAAATVPHVAVVPAIDLPLSDVVHISAFGNMALGLRLARAALGMAYGRDVAYRAPETQAAQRIEDGRVVELVFRNVTSRMECNDLTSIPFRIEQDGATAPIAAVTYPGGPLVRITMAEPLVGPAVVHGAYGMNPPRVPMDVERQMPMLGFCDIPIG